jgi:hypothetical protein
MKKQYTQAAKRAEYIDRFGYEPTGNLGVDAVAAIIHYDRRRGMPPEAIYLSKEYFREFKKFAIAKSDAETAALVEQGLMALEFDGVAVMDAGTMTNKRWIVKYMTSEVNA